MTKRLYRRSVRLALLTALVAGLGAVSAGTASAEATTTTDNQFFPFELVAFGCGDIIDVTGTLHALTHVTVDSAGGIAFKTHFQPQGGTGVGLISGATYHATGVTQEEISNNGPGPQLSDTFINNFRMISSGTTPNYDVHETGHITVNNNGEVTVFFDNFTVECHG